MATPEQQTKILALLGSGETLTDTAEEMNKDLEPGQRPFTRNSIAGISFRFRKANPEKAPPPDPKMQLRKAQQKSEGQPARKVGEAIIAAIVAVGQTQPLTASIKPIVEPIDMPVVTANEKAADAKTQVGQRGRRSARPGSLKRENKLPVKPTTSLKPKRESRAPGPRNIEELSACDCHWPSKADPSSGRTSSFYCESPAIEGKPYCARHLLIAHNRSNTPAAA